jgi:zinc/manganese transport system substrate-binding protein
LVAAENFWGNLAVQLAGDRATVSSIVTNPTTDPHSYQPSTADARRLAGANMVILNGLGYDSWATQLLRASPGGGRVVLDVGKRLGLAEGANPHRWYYPADVRAVIAVIAAEYRRLDPADAAYFAARRHRLEAVGLARYDHLRAEIRARFAGAPVGYSESIFEGLGEDLGLRLLTPPSFARAIAEGTDVTAADKRAVDAQAQARRIKVWVYNAQNVTPDVQRVNEIVGRRRVPLVTVTETLAPAGISFQQWQDAQLEALLKALERHR